MPSRAIRLVVVLMVLAALVPIAAFPAGAISTTVVISEVYGGGGNSGATYTHDFIELKNLTASGITLDGWSVQYASAAGTTWSVTPLAGVLPAGGAYLIQQAQGAGGMTPLPSPNASGTTAMSATAGKVVLVNSTVALSGSCPAAGVDLVGYGSTANCSETAPTATLSNTTSASRGTTDTDNNAVDFTVGTPNPESSVSDQGPAVSATTPADSATGVPLASDLTVSFSEPVNVAGSWFTISCSTSGVHTAVVTGGPSIFTLSPDSDFAATDICTVTITATVVTDVDTNDPPDAMTADFVFSFAASAPVDQCTLTYIPAYAIQGSGSTAAITGTVTTQGVVVGDFEGPAPTLRGFYLQDSAGDGSSATSDAVFVFNASNNSVALGDVVRVTGNASDFQDQTQVSATSVTPCGTGTIAPVDVALPVASPTFLEQYEGMLVRFPQTLFVTELFQLGRFSQVTMSSGDRLDQPTNVVAPGEAANALQAANNLNRVIVDDALNNQNPDPLLFGREGNPLSATNTLRGGDTLTGAVGVMTYTWAGNAASPNAYRLRTINALGGAIPNFSLVNARPPTPNEVGGSVVASTFNLLNYFNTFTGCTFGVGGGAADCRGASNATEFERQAAKTVSAIVASDADVIGINEVENDGYGGQSAIRDLVNRLNNATAPGSYALIDFDAATGQVNALGTDAIKIGLIYRPAVVTPTGTTAVLNSLSFVNAGDSGPRNRPTYAQAFADNNGGVFVVSGNHFKSKGSPCDAPDQGDGQGNCAAVRTNAARMLAAFLASDPTNTEETDILILGDLNSYAKEDPITALLAAGYTNLVLQRLGEDAYSFVFDGQWGYLDHALGYRAAVDQVTGVTEWHVNADEPPILDYNLEFKSVAQQALFYAPDQYRMSDHDPVLVGLDLVPTFAFSGFFSPVSNYPAVNRRNTGSNVPVKFNLGGNQGLAVVEYVDVRTIDCATGTVLATDSAATTVSYDSRNGQYTYSWKTQKAWSGSCRLLEITLTDGTLHRLRFDFN